MTKRKKVIFVLCALVLAAGALFAYLNTRPDPALQPFLGEWTVTQRLLIPRAYSERELEERNMVGKKVIIEEHYFYDVLSNQNPIYKVTEISGSEFLNDLLSSFAGGGIENLEILKNNRTIKKLDVYRDDKMNPVTSLIETLYFYDHDTLVVNDNYIAIYELKRIK